MKSWLLLGSFVLALHPGAAGSAPDPVSAAAMVQESVSKTGTIFIHRSAGEGAEDTVRVAGHAFATEGVTAPNPRPFAVLIALPGSIRPLDPDDACDTFEPAIALRWSFAATPYHALVSPDCAEILLTEGDTVLRYALDERAWKRFMEVLAPYGEE